MGQLWSVFTAILENGGSAVFNHCRGRPLSAQWRPLTSLEHRHFFPSVRRHRLESSVRGVSHSDAEERRRGKKRRGEKRREEERIGEKGREKKRGEEDRRGQKKREEKRMFA